MGNNTQSRKWALVINNPLEAGLDHAAIQKILHRFSPAQKTTFLFWMIFSRI